MGAKIATSLYGWGEVSLWRSECLLVLYCPRQASSYKACIQMEVTVLALAQRCRVNALPCTLQDLRLIKKLKPKEFLVIFLDLWLYSVNLILDENGMS